MKIPLVFLVLLFSGCVCPDSVTLSVYSQREKYGEYGQGKSEGIGLDFTWELK